VYETREIPRLLEDLGAHLRAQGWEGTLALKQSNETPLAPLASVFTPGVTEGIRSVYGKDFDAFGYTDVTPDKTEAAGEYPPALLVAVARLAERGERLGDLALNAQSLAEGNRALRARNTMLRSRNKTLRDRNTTLRDRNTTLRSRNKTLRDKNNALASRPGVRSLARRVHRKLLRPR
jgi:cell division protein FtsB